MYCNIHFPNFKKKNQQQIYLSFFNYLFLSKSFLIDDIEICGILF